MKKILVSIAVCLPLLAVVSCNQMGTSNQSAVAVIDLDKIASSLGWLNEMNSAMQSADSNLRGQLDQILQAGIKSVDDTKKEIIAAAKLDENQVKALNEVRDVRELEKLPLTADQRKKLVDTLNQANYNLQVARNQYQQIMQNRRSELVMAYREKIKPIARRIASAHGMTVILTTADPVLYSAPQTSITEEVIDEMIKTYGKTSPAPQPVAAPAAPTTEATTAPKK